MTFKVISGSGTPEPLTDWEKFVRKEQLKSGLSSVLSSTQGILELSSTLTTPDKEKGAMIHFGVMEVGALVTIRAVFNDAQSGADVMITNMTTLPPYMCRQGYGTRALQLVLEAIKKKGLINIQATQVQRPSEHFWVKNGFYRLGNSTNDYRLGLA